MILALNLQLETAGSIPATALSSVTFGKFLTRCTCHQAVYKLGSKAQVKNSLTF